MQIGPFHISFVVPDLREAVEFYVNVLGCDVGRDSGDWVDVIFFGHQLTMHQVKPGLEVKPIDHFGPILDKNEWEVVADRLSARGIRFVLDPVVKGDTCDSQSGKYVVKDPAGNLLEFKFYNGFSLPAKSVNREVS